LRRKYKEIQGRTRKQKQKTKQNKKKEKKSQQIGSQGDRQQQPRYGLCMERKQF
jgi:hypothetical protein